MRLFGEKRRYEVIAAEACEEWACELQEKLPEFFRFHKTKWDKFPDGTDKIVVGGFHPVNCLRGKHVIFLASFHDNSTTLSQLYVCITLLESLVESLTIVMPFYPVGETVTSICFHQGKRFSCFFLTKVLSAFFHLRGPSVNDGPSVTPLLCVRCLGICLRYHAWFEIFLEENHVYNLTYNFDLPQKYVLAVQNRFHST